MTGKQTKILAVIPARSGSVGIKNKNIRIFAGKPLIVHSIEQGRSARLVDRLIVSTDSEAYAAIARKHGAEVPFLRPKRLATSTSPVVDAVVHLLDGLKQREGYEPDYVVLLQTTSPLRDATDIDACISIALKKKCDGVVSVCPTEQLLYAIDKDMLSLLHRTSWVYHTNRQSLPNTYRLNGSAVYVIKTKVLKKNRSFIKGNLAAYVMDKWRSVDLDNEEDFVVGEYLFKNKRKIAQALAK